MAIGPWICSLSNISDELVNSGTTAWLNCIAWFQSFPEWLQTLANPRQLACWAAAGV